MRARAENRTAQVLATVAALLTIGVVAAHVTRAAQPESVVVHVRPKPAVRANIHLSFRAGGQLPAGGYYYGVIVLGPYKHYTSISPPPCSFTSDMLKTNYGYPKSNEPVRLTLTPAKSRTGHWCHGGSYSGAIYAVPHPPPCEAKYPCRAEPYERSPCWEIETGRRVCGGVAAPKEYEYLDGLPRPLAQGTRIVGRFSVHFR